MLDDVLVDADMRMIGFNAPPQNIPITANSRLGKPPPSLPPSRLLRSLSVSHKLRSQWRRRCAVQLLAKRRRRALENARQRWRWADHALSKRRLALN